MIWFFGTSHTDGFADGIKQDCASFSHLVADSLDVDYINFGTSGANNTQIYNALKSAINDKSLTRPSTIIIEPRNFWDFKVFPRLYDTHDQIESNDFEWRNKNDAMYVAWKNDYKQVYKIWRELVDNNQYQGRKFTKQFRTNLLNLQTAMTTGPLSAWREGNDVVNIVDDTRKGYPWIPKQSHDMYDKWISDWYTTYQDLTLETFSRKHQLSYIKLANEISGLILLAKSVTDQVGFMLWEMSDYDLYKKQSAHLDSYEIFDSPVHNVLKSKHPVEYETSKQTYIDAHLGPEAHTAIAPYIKNWIGKNANT